MIANSVKVIFKTVFEKAKLALNCPLTDYYKFIYESNLNDFRNDVVFLFCHNDLTISCYTYNLPLCKVRPSQNNRYLIFSSLV